MNLLSLLVPLSVVATLLVRQAAYVVTERDRTAVGRLEEMGRWIGVETLGDRLGCVRRDGAGDEERAKKAHDGWVLGIKRTS